MLALDSPGECFDSAFRSPGGSPELGGFGNDPNDPSSSGVPSLVSDPWEEYEPDPSSLLLPDPDDDPFFSSTGMSGASHADRELDEPEREPDREPDEPDRDDVDRELEPDEPELE